MSYLFEENTTEKADQHQQQQQKTLKPSDAWTGKGTKDHGGARQRGILPLSIYIYTKYVACCDVTKMNDIFLCYGTLWNVT